MSVKPYTFIDRRQSQTGSNSLIRAATQTTDRLQVAMLDADTHRTVTGLGRRVALSVGRELYQNCSPIRAAVDEIARLATSVFIPQSYAKDVKWRTIAEEYLYEGDQFIDVRGYPYSMQTYLRNLVREVLVDGDQGTLLAEVDGSAKIQVWRSHRIGSRTNARIIAGGEYDGATIIDGVVVDDVGRRLAYGLVNNSWEEPFAYVSENNFLLNFLPNTSDALRGYSALTTAAFDMQDLNEFKQWTLIKQKIAASLAIEVQNGTGVADRTQQLMAAPSTDRDANGNATDLPTEMTKPGRYVYFKAGEGQTLRVVPNNEPGPDLQAHHTQIIRESLQSLGWSYDFAHDATKIGGASMRVVIEKVNARLEEIRDLLVRPVMRRITGWRIAKAIKAGFIPENPEWFKWTFQCAAKLTADRKYDAEVDLLEARQGWLTDKQAIAKRGGFIEDEDAEHEAHAATKWGAAQRIATQFGIPIEKAYASMWSDQNALASATPVQSTPSENDNNGNSIAA